MITASRLRGLTYVLRLSVMGFTPQVWCLNCRVKYVAEFAEFLEIQEVRIV